MHGAVLRATYVLVNVCVLAEHAKAYRSCSQNGVAKMPCRDSLSLGTSERFMITMLGHSCYDVSLRSAEPLNAYLYDSSSMNFEQIIEPSEQLVNRFIHRNRSQQFDHQHSDMTLCVNSSSCHEKRPGLAAHSLYNLVISRSRRSSVADAPDAATSTVFVELRHCDPLSISRYAGLVLAGTMGFVSVILCLCLIGEYMLDLRSITRLRKSLDKIQFIELATMQRKPSHEDPPAIAKCTPLPVEVQVDVDVQPDDPDSPTSDPTEDQPCLSSIG